MWCTPVHRYADQGGRFGGAQRERAGVEAKTINAALCRVTATIQNGRVIRLAVGRGGAGG